MSETPGLVLTRVTSLAGQPAPWTYLSPALQHGEHRGTPPCLAVCVSARDRRSQEALCGVSHLSRLLCCAVFCPAEFLALMNSSLNRGAAFRLNISLVDSAASSLLTYPWGWAPAGLPASSSSALQLGSPGKGVPGHAEPGSPGKCTSVPAFILHCAALH